MSANQFIQILSKIKFLFNNLNSFHICQLFYFKCDEKIIENHHFVICTMTRSSIINTRKEKGSLQMRLNMVE